MRRIALLLAFALAGCEDAAAPPSTAPPPPLVETAPDPPPPLGRDSVPPSRPRPADVPTPFDRATVVFDTLEPLPPRVEIQPRPAPPRPDPAPAPSPAPPAASAAQAAGSCDVRSTESFCFAYTGPGWSSPEARTHCGNAPESAYRPAGCPLEDAIATCRFLRDDAPSQEILYTYYAPYPLPLAELACPGDFERIADG